LLDKVSYLSLYIDVYLSVFAINLHLSWHYNATSRQVQPFNKRIAQVTINNVNATLDIQLIKTSISIF
jgi:hypothetical protein